MNRPPVRQHIIQTASNLFYEKGYNLTGINEIISEAGIAKATLYHHFKSKEDICLAYLVHMQAGFMTDITAFIDSKTLGPQRLLAIFEFLLQFYNKEGFNGCWCVNTLSELPKEDERVREEIRNEKLAFLELINTYVDQVYEGMTKAKRKALSRQIYLLYEGAVSESNLHDDKWPIETAKATCKQLLA